MTTNRTPENDQELRAEAAESRIEKMKELVAEWRTRAERVKPKGMSGEPEFSHTDAIAYAVISDWADQAEAILED